MTVNIILNTHSREFNIIIYIYTQQNHNLQINHYGKCNIDYVVNVEGDTQRLVRKSLDPRICTGHPCRNWSNVPKVQCTDEDQVCYRVEILHIFIYLIDIEPCYAMLYNMFSNTKTFRILS